MSNRVSTGKYTLWNFLPKNLFLQFTKMANFYFLVMGCLQLYPPISSSGGWLTTFMSVGFICGISAIKDAFEDRKRHKSDEEENMRPCGVLPFGGHEFAQTTSQDIKVGQLVRVRENEFFPCDMYLLTSSLPKGMSFVETKNLDGETNLKHKQADKNVLRLARTEQDCMTNFNGASIECEAPNEFLYKFEGNLTQRDGAVISMGPDQILLRGSSLRNTEWVIGVTVFTGHETKVMKNSA